MRLHVGTSGFSYKEWKGSFYPADQKAAGMLAYYASKLSTVEINNTFYRMPKAEQLEAWRAQVPEGFTFVLKAPRRITHIKRLADSADLVEAFLGAAKAMGDRLGPLLFQLPPFAKKNQARLADFLALLPEGTRAAFEFRNPTWFDEEIYSTLRGRGSALCVSDDEDGEPPLVATAAWGYLRLRRQDYDDAAIRRWADYIAAQKWDDAFVFFKHEDAGAGPALAERLKTIFATRAS